MVRLFATVFAIFVTPLLAASVPFQTQGLTVPRGTTRSTMTLFKTINNSSITANSSSQTLAAPPRIYHFRLPDLPYLIVYKSDLDRPIPSWSLQDTRRFFLQTRVDLARQKSAARPATKVPGRAFSYISPTLGHGMAWVVMQDEDKHPTMPLTFDIVTIALIGTNQLVRYYAPGEMVKAIVFVVFYEQSPLAPPTYLAQGHLDSLPG